MITVINDKELGKVEIVTQQYQDRLLKLIKKDSPLTCSDCERWGTMDCPNSYMCYSTKDKPYFKSKHNGK